MSVEVFVRFLHGWANLFYIVRLVSFYPFLPALILSSEIRARHRLAQPSSILPNHNFSCCHTYLHTNTHSQTSLPQSLPSLDRKGRIQQPRRASVPLCSFTIPVLHTLL